MKKVSEIPVMLVDKNTTLEEAKQFLRDNWGDKGLKCPCCKQNVIKWKHKLNAQIAWCLIQVYKIQKNSNVPWVHILREIKPSNRMYSLARWWELLEAKPFNKDEDKPASGYWRLTVKGETFVENKIRISRHVFLFDNHIFGRSLETVNITEALGDKFSYNELLNT